MADLKDYYNASAIKTQDGIRYIMLVITLFSNSYTTYPRIDELYFNGVIGKSMVILRISLVIGTNRAHRNKNNAEDFWPMKCIIVSNYFTFRFSMDLRYFYRRITQNYAN